MGEAAAKSVIETPLLAAHRAQGAVIGTWFGCSLPDHFSGCSQQSQSPIWLGEYRAARESVAVLDKNYRAYLKFTGADRVRYLNAILTNNIKDLRENYGVISLFLNP